MKCLLLMSGGMLMLLLFAPNSPAAIPEKSAADVLGGEVVVKVIRDADKVLVYRLKDEEGKKTIEGYDIASGPAKVDAEVAKALAEVVTRFETYERDAAVGCIPRYGMRTQFSSGDKTVDVVYCLSCNILVVYCDGKIVGSGLFKDDKPFIRLAKQMLPDDAAIQALK